ncbi:sensor histidine kinase [Cesiribacter andamanensis]|uniref:Putative sensor-like histidine kinase YehU n=1 Tax=Cesiribacter andamanensis AMV16 TaxID=1279009 RepID=M7NPG7_9BACT|nr:histidine kinase [Cesiribacter andamanensis]EMR03615.1 putative sensor-like histidine kinase YehU [Cesiribacter andamanensis AMV16]
MSPNAVNTSSWRGQALGIFLLSLGFTVLNNLDGSHQISSLLTSFFFTLVVCAAMWLGNGWITDQISNHISWVEKPVLRFTLGVGAMVVYTTLIYMLIFETIEWYIGREFSSRTYWQSMIITMVITTLISLLMHARSFLLNWRQAAIDRERLEKAHVASQYQSLRNQVNPHFLFNSFNVLTELVHQDADLAERFVRQLSKVYRYVLEKRDAEVVPLQEELTFLKSFLFLQEIRQPGTLLVAWPQGVSDELGVPPLALQLLAENTIKHNVLDANHPLTLRLRIQEGMLVVENQLRPLQQPAAGTGVGLSNLSQRYGYLSTIPVQVQKTADSFIVKLPLLKIPVYESALG